MKKLLYLTTWDFSDGPSTGITKKIKAQIKVFEANGFSVDYTYISDNYMYLCRNGKSVALGKVGKLRKLAGNFLLYRVLKKTEYPYVYNRYGLMDHYYYKILKALCKNGSRIIVELPTYPYDKERPKGISWWLLYAIDKIYRRHIDRYIYKIAVYDTMDKKIFRSEVVSIVNGIDFSTVLPIEVVEKTADIHLIAVAGLADWHGYDRLLKGMGEYYKKGGNRNIIFHIVGDGEPVVLYKKIIKTCNLERHVMFHGVKTGSALDEIYNQCDIGIEVLGGHRKGITLSSSLKSREYAAKGLPFVTSCYIDVFDDMDFVLKFPAGETPIKMELVVAFYDKIYKNKDKQLVINRIRNQSKEKCDIFQVMIPVVKAFEES